MPEQRVIFGQRGGKSFQAGYEAGYAQCKLDISNEPPTTGEIVRELETLLPPMTNYAESVCAEGAFAHSTYMVWDDPEPYIIKNGIDRLKSQEQKIADKDAKIATLTEKAEAMENDLINLDMNLTEMTARAEQAEAREKAIIESLRDRCEFCIGYELEESDDPCSTCYNARTFEPDDIPRTKNWTWRGLPQAGEESR